jgi:hypothetical protein
MRRVGREREQIRREEEGQEEERGGKRARKGREEDSYRSKPKIWLFKHLACAYNGSCVTLVVLLHVTPAFVVVFFVISFAPIWQLGTCEFCTSSSGARRRRLFGGCRFWCGRSLGFSGRGGYCLPRWRRFGWGSCSLPCWCSLAFRCFVLRSDARGGDVRRVARASWVRRGGLLICAAVRWSVGRVVSA